MKYFAHIFSIFKFCKSFLSIIFHRKFSFTNFMSLFEQAQEMFCKQQCSQKFRKIHRKFSPATLLKRSLQRRCFPVNFAKFLKTRFMQKPSATPSELLLLFSLKFELLVIPLVIKNYESSLKSFYVVGYIKKFS